jgi:hypothetical protein
VNENEVQAWDLKPDSAQVFSYDTTKLAYVPANTYVGAGVHVYSKTPIIVYVMVRFIYTSDGWCAIPTSSLGKDYVVATYTDYYISSTFRLPGISTITAPYDNTKVTIKMGGSNNEASTIVTESGETISSGQTYSLVLQRGDVFCMMTRGKNKIEDITGTRITSSKPVSVVSGHQCTDIPVGNHWCDYTVEAQVPTDTWGKSILIPKIFHRTFSGVLRIFAKEDSTTIYRNGVMVGFIPKSSGVEGKGWLEMRVLPKFQFNKDQFAVYTADKPFSINYYNPGIQEDMENGNNVNSDPFNILMMPVEQFKNSVFLSTPAIIGGQNFPSNYINLIYEINSNGLMPDDLEIGKFENEKWNWKKVDSKIESKDDTFKIEINSKRYACKLLQLEGDGLYQFRCNSSKIMAYSYGYSNYDSYGYPSSMNLNKLFTNDSLAPIPSYMQDCYGNIDNGFVYDDSRDGKLNRTNLATITMNIDSSYNYDLTYTDFEVDTVSSTNWQMKVLDPNKAAKAYVNFMDRAGNDTTILIEYFPTEMNLQKSEYFGVFKLTDAKIIRQFTFTNTSKNKDFVVSKLELQKNNEYFSIVKPLKWDISKAIKAGESRIVEIEFDPKKMPKGELSFQDSLIISNSCNQAYGIQVYASQAYGSIYIMDVDFSKVDIGLNPITTKMVTYSNSGNYAYKITSIKNFSDTSKFICEFLPGLHFPYSFDAGAVAVFNITFKSKEVGKFIDTLIIHSDAIEGDSLLIVKAEAYSTVSINDDGTSGNPILFTLSASPNPFGESTEVKYNLAGNMSKHVEINLVNSAGQKIETLVSQTQNPGEYSLQYNSKQLAQGTYYLIANVSGYSTQLPVIIAR